MTDNPFEGRTTDRLYEVGIFDGSDGRMPGTQVKRFAEDGATITWTPESNGALMIDLFQTLGSYLDSLGFETESEGLGMIYEMFMQRNLIANAIHEKAQEN